MSGPVDVLLVEDHELVLGAIEAALSAHPELKVSATATSLAEARAALASGRFDVIVTDLVLGDGNGNELVADAAELDPPAPVLLVTGEHETRGIDEALASGCAGFISKTEGFDRLVDAITAIAGGGVFFPADLMRAALRTRTDPAAQSLTPRELEVLQLLADARSVDEIAEHLILSLHTVRNHVQQILNKLGARSQLEAVVLGARSGLVRIR